MSPGGNGNGLTSWKEIAGYLGVRVRTAQKWEAEHGLPVRRQTGRKSRVYAVKSELDEWRMGHLSKLRWWQRLSWVLWYASAATVAAVAALSWVGFTAWDRWASRDPARFQIDYSSLRIMDIKGRELWSHRFGEPLQKEAYNGQPGQRRLWIGDLDGDGRSEVIFAEYPYNDSSPGHLYCFASDGRVRWSYAPPPVRDRERGYEPVYVTSGFEILDREAGAGRRIAALWRHRLYHPTEFVLLEADGRVSGRYWHSGHLDYMDFTDLDGDSREEALLAGVNNGFGKATLVVLKPSELSAASTQDPGDPHQIDGLPVGREMAVVRFARTCVSRHFDLYNIARDVAMDGKANLHLAVYEHLGQDNERILYTLGRDLRIVSLEPTDAFLGAHRSLESEQVLKHSFRRSELDELAAQAEVRRGGGQWTALPRATRIVTTAN
jgi:hypothetical protein